MSNSDLRVKGESGVQTKSADREHETLSPMEVRVKRFVALHADEIDANHDGGITLEELSKFAGTHRDLIERSKLLTPENPDQKFWISEKSHHGFSWQKICDSVEKNPDNNGQWATFDLKAKSPTADAPSARNPTGSTENNKPHQGNGHHNEGSSGRGHQSIDLVNRRMRALEPLIKKVAEITGVPADIIAGQVWAESRGNPNVGGSKNRGNGAMDVGLLQISQKTWDKDAPSNNKGIKATLSASEKRAVKEFTGHSFDDLKVGRSNKENLIAGAFELKAWLDHNHGNLKAALGDYVGHDREAYYKNVMIYAKAAREGKPMPDQDPYDIGG